MTNSLHGLDFLRNIVINRIIPASGLHLIWTEAVNIESMLSVIVKRWDGKWSCRLASTTAFYNLCDLWGGINQNWNLCQHQIHEHIRFNVTLSQSLTDNLQELHVCLTFMFRCIFDMALGVNPNILQTVVVVLDYRR